MLPEKSLPSRECGLKYRDKPIHNIIWKVTPFAGVWIEISVDGWLYDEQGRSLPSRECGLKSTLRKTESYEMPSLPSRECGLK